MDCRTLLCTNCWTGSTSEVPLSRVTFKWVYVWCLYFVLWLMHSSCHSHRTSYCTRQPLIYHSCSRVKQILPPSNLTVHTNSAVMATNQNSEGTAIMHNICYIYQIVTLSYCDAVIVQERMTLTIHCTVWAGTHATKRLKWHWSGACIGSCMD